ncbi:hypothetical protein PG993_011239 [Apiospora rasikravindrae]|uniref:Cyanovirin-N domain-containing protein n=1 Tax=Apiospora rasikravindrae TaxID=990691 RepID=A0ABR1SDN7_9PEZI
MKMFVQLTSLLALVLCVAADDPPYGAPGDLQCLDIALIDGPTITASCPVADPGRIYLCSHMMINQCFANQDGYLVAREKYVIDPNFLLQHPNATWRRSNFADTESSGNAGNSCNNCKMTDTILQCDCLISTQTSLRQTTHIDTNVAIVNHAGQMKCFGQKATLWNC